MRIVWVIGWIIRKDFVRVIHRIRKGKIACLRAQSVLIREKAWFYYRVPGHAFIA